jgi:hypothetical protein
MNPTIGRIVIFTVTALQAKEINCRRTIGNENEVYAGYKFPMIVTAIFQSSTNVNGQVFLDGNDVLWVQHVTEMKEGEDPEGKWCWPNIMGT